MIGSIKKVENIKHERINGKRVKTFEVWSKSESGWVLESTKVANRRTSDKKIKKAFSGILGNYIPIL